ncbi:uncharacterized protein [Nicotiana tomentosiformis]|uniref:uncharacterized protein n=1 Tax=Nicotiana tomentosiformis TaxID=4098 RepID=UPI00388C76E5
MRGVPPPTTQALRIPSGPQASQSMVVAPVATPPSQTARDRGWVGRGRPRGRGQARYYALLAMMEAVASDLVITGSTYSYVSSYFSPYLGTSRDSLSYPVYVSTPVGDSLVVDHMYRLCLVVLSGFETRADLLLLSMVDFDVILGMDWLSPYHAIIDCHAKTMTLAMLGLPQLEWRGTLDYVPSMVISFLKAQWMVEKGCDAYLAYARDVSVDTSTVDSVLVVRQVQKLRSKNIASMKVQWRGQPVEKASRETKHDMRSRYPHLFTTSGCLVSSLEEFWSDMGHIVPKLEV